MMRFKEFLLQEDDIPRPHTQTVGLDEAVRFFRENPAARDLLKNNTPPMFRGMGSDKIDYQYGDSRTFTRVAANTDNYVNLFLSSSPPWADIPKRANSFICSNDVGGTSGYGVKYAVFPADKAKVARCNSSDFWDAFRRTIPGTNVNQWNDHISWLQWSVPGEEGKKISSQEGGRLRSALEKLDAEALKKIVDVGEEDGYRVGKENSARYFLNLMKDYNVGNVATLMDKVFDPALNDIRTVKGQDVARLKSADRHEMWIEGPTFFILYGGWETWDEAELQKKILDAASK